LAAPLGASFFFGFALAVCFQKSSSKKCLPHAQKPRKRILSARACMLLLFLSSALKDLL
jgi:hypothetical protein